MTLYNNIKAEVTATADSRMRKHLTKCLPVLAKATAADDWLTDESLVVVVATPKACTVTGIPFWPTDATAEPPPVSPTAQPARSPTWWAEAMIHIVESDTTNAPGIAMCLAGLLGMEELTTSMAEAAQLTAFGKRPVMVVLLVRHANGIAMLRTTVAMTTTH